MPSCTGHFEPTDRLNLCLMSKILYAGGTGLSAVILAQYVLELCVAAEIVEKSIKPPILALVFQAADGEDLVILACIVFD